MIADIQNVLPYMQRGIGLVFGVCEKPKPANAIWLDEENPHADYVMPFEVAGAEKDKFDFVRLWRYIRKSLHGVMFILRKSIHSLKPGGYLLIIEAAQKEEGARSFYNFFEMEGLLMLFEDYIHIEARGLANKDKSYYYICRKKGDKNAKQDSETGGEVQNSAEKTEAVENKQADAKS